MSRPEVELVGVFGNRFIIVKPCIAALYRAGQGDRAVELLCDVADATSDAQALVIAEDYVKITHMDFMGGSEVVNSISSSIEESIGELSLHFKMGRQQARTFMDPVLTLMTKRFNLDIVKLDDWLHAQGYKEELHGSMRDYITLTYGPEARDFVLRLIGS